MPSRALAPGIDFETLAADRAGAEVLRPDIFGLGGVFERGPLFVARRIEDWGQQRATFGGFLRLRGRGRRQAFGPLAAYGFQQNGGGTAIVVRIAGSLSRPALATLPDPASGGLIGLLASSAGAWANGVRVEVPLRVRARLAVASFPLLGHDLLDRSIVRVVAPAGLAFGRLVRAGAGLTLAPPTTLAGPYVVECLEPLVDVTVDGAGRRERFRQLSLDPDSDQYLGRRLRVQAPLGPEWQPRVPAAWAPLERGLALSLAHQGPAASALLRTVALPSVTYASPVPLAPPWLPPSAATQKSAAGILLEATLEGGVDAVSSVDVGAFRAAIELLAEHPLPSFVALPDLMLGFRAVEDPCPRVPDATRLPEPEPEPEPCAERARTVGDGTETDSAWPVAEVDVDDDLPLLAPAAQLASTVQTLQLDLLEAIARAPDGAAERIALLDPLPALAPTQALAQARSLGDSAALPELGALFYPWLRVLNPANAGATTTFVPASGHVAGMMARTSRAGGPAARFANEILNGAVGVERTLGYEERGLLNSGQVSALRSVASRGSVVFGERTLAFAAGPLSFVPGARVLAYLRRTLRAVGQTLVFEPNDQFLWLRICVTLEGALRDLFEQGAFAGRTPDESYRVRCDEATNPADQRALGRVLALVDVALSVPLEFISIRIAFTRDGARVLDDVAPEGEG